MIVTVWLINESMAVLFTLVKRLERPKEWLERPFESEDRAFVDLLDMTSTVWMLFTQGLWIQTTVTWTDMLSNYLIPNEHWNDYWMCIKHSKFLFADNSWTFNHIVWTWM